MTVVTLTWCWLSGEASLHELSIYIPTSGILQGTRPTETGPGHATRYYTDPGAWVVGWPQREVGPTLSPCSGIRTNPLPASLRQSRQTGLIFLHTFRSMKRTSYRPKYLWITRTRKNRTCRVSESLPQQASSHCRILTPLDGELVFSKSVPDCGNPQVDVREV